MVPHHGGRHIDALPAGDARAQAELSVVAVGEEILVEAADLVQHALAVHGGASVRPKALVRKVELTAIQRAGSSPAILPVRVDQVSGLVDTRRSS